MASVSFTMRLTKVGELLRISDKLFKVELTGIELGGERKENVLRVQGLNLTADLFLKMVPGMVLYLTCDLDGRIWVKDGREIFFLNLVVTSFKDITPDGSVDRVIKKPDSLPDLNFDNELPF